MVVVIKKRMSEFFFWQLGSSVIYSTNASGRDAVQFVKEATSAFSHPDSRQKKKFDMWVALEQQTMAMLHKEFSITGKLSFAFQELCSSCFPYDGDRLIKKIEQLVYRTVEFSVEGREALEHWNHVKYLMHCCGYETKTQLDSHPKRKIPLLLEVLSRRCCADCDIVMGTVEFNELIWQRGICVLTCDTVDENETDETKVDALDETQIAEKQETTVVDMPNAVPVFPARWAPPKFPRYLHSGQLSKFSNAGGEIKNHQVDSDISDEDGGVLVDIHKKVLNFHNDWLCCQSPRHILPAALLEMKRRQKKLLMSDPFLAYLTLCELQKPTSDLREQLRQLDISDGKHHSKYGRDNECSVWEHLLSKLLVVLSRRWAHLFGNDDQRALQWIQRCHSMTLSDSEASQVSSHPNVQEMDVNDLVLRFLFFCREIVHLPFFHVYKKNTYSQVLAPPLTPNCHPVWKNVGEFDAIVVELVSGTLMHVLEVKANPADLPVAENQRFRFVRLIGDHVATENQCKFRINCSNLCRDQTVEKLIFPIAYSKLSLPFSDPHSAIGNWFIVINIRTDPSGAPAKSLSSFPILSQLRHLLIVMVAHITARGPSPDNRSCISLVRMLHSICVKKKLTSPLAVLHTLETRNIADCLFTIPCRNNEPEVAL